MRKKKKPILTPKQRKLLREIAKTPEAGPTELARRAGYANRDGVHAALKSPNVQAYMLQDKRFQAPAMLEKLAEGMEATKKGEADWGNRFKFLQLGFQLRGDLSRSEEQKREDLGAILEAERRKRGLHPFEDRRLRPGEDFDQIIDVTPEEEPAPEGGTGGAAA